MTRFLVMGDSLLRELPVSRPDTTPLCYPGETIQRLMRRLRHQPALVEGYEIVMVLVGTNNVANGQRAITIANMLSDLVRLIKSLTQARVVVSGILPRSAYDRKPEHMNYDYTGKNINKMMAHRLGPDFMKTTRFLTNNLAKPGLIDRDGLHLTNEGKAVLWDCFLNVITKR